MNPQRLTPNSVAAAPLRASAPARSVGSTRHLYLGVWLSVLLVSVTTHAQLAVRDGLMLWLKAEVGASTESGAAVSAWQDQSPNANHATPRWDGTPEERPLLSPGAAGGKPVIRFDGVDDVLEIPNSSTLQPASGNWTVFFVAKRLGASQGDFPQIIGSRPWVAGLDKGWSVSLSSAGNVASHFADGSAGHDVPAVLSSRPRDCPRRPSRSGRSRRTVPRV